MEYSTYLSPWYFNKKNPAINKEYKWRYEENLNGHSSGLTCLYHKDKCLGILDIYCYIKPIQNNRFLIWERGKRIIELYDTSDLKEINKNEIDWKKLNKKFFFLAEPIDKIEYYFDLYETRFRFEFPQSFKEIDEIIQVNDLDGLYKDYKQGMMNTAIVILKPKQNKIEIFPQDWFNRSNEIDFGYQWITRADRIKNSNQLKVQGFRIDEFKLDQTNRDIEK